MYRFPSVSKDLNKNVDISERSLVIHSKKRITKCASNGDCVISTAQKLVTIRKVEDEDQMERILHNFEQSPLSIDKMSFIVDKEVAIVCNNVLSILKFKSKKV